jgi:hypothetical protein
MKTITKAGLGVLGVLALVMLQAGPAGADPTAQANDVTGVGSDTAQYGLNFLAEGVNGNAGFNTGSLDRRLFSVDATADAAGGPNAPAPAPAPKAVLRAGAQPITRPNGSGAGITALLADCVVTAGVCDTTRPEQINWVRSSRLPNAGEQATANDATHAWGGLHVYQFATDGLSMAVSNQVPTNVPAVLTPANLVCIYQGQNTVGGTCPQFSTVVPFLPQTGSGTRNFFLADLQAANGGVAITLGSNVQTMQEHDPTLIQGNANAVGPFSIGRFGLLNSGYLGAGGVNAVKLLTAAGNYNVTRGLYIIVRERDVHDHTILPATGLTASGQAFPWQVGGARNWVETLFSGPTSWVAKAANNSLISGAFVTPAYSDLGVVSG